MHGRSLASTLDAGVTETLSRLRAAWDEVHEPTAPRWPSFGTCRSRALRDIDNNRGELAQIARREVYGR